MYDQREKALRDYEWAMAGARQEGEQKGRQEGSELGLAAGKIQILQELLGDKVSSENELLAQSKMELEAKLAVLQSRLRTRET